ncbi:TetR/AcrR family transcriptional regulator [Staphylococcus chromogenes]|nr:TetR/AcrR family transcriptional regulator [Staphylococcus chromogenes]
MPENKQRSDARQNKERILGTVNQLSQQGVDISEMKMTEIAKQANVGVGTLYRHFENKAVLCIAMMDAQVETMFDEIQHFLATHATATAYERVKGILQI